MNKVHVDVAGGVIIFFVALFVYTKLIGPIPFFITSVTTAKQNLFQVQGTGQVAVIPNTADFSFGVTKTAATVADAQSQTNAAIAAIINSVKSLGVDAKDIQTTNYSVNPQYNYAVGNQAVTGYTVTQNIEVKISPIDKASQAIDKATANGANVIGGLSFTVDDQTQKDLQDQARKKAIAAAKQKAQSLTSAAGMGLGKIIDIQEAPANIPLPRPIFMLAGAKADTQSTELPAGQSTISTTVTLTYETY